MFIKGMRILAEGTVTAIAAYSKAAELNPNHPYVHFNLANVLLRNKEYDRAINNYTIFLKKSKDMKLLIDAHIGKGNAFFELGKYDQAIEWLIMNHLN